MAAMLDRGLSRLEEVCGGFHDDDDLHPPEMNKGAKVSSSDQPCLIHGWHDDDHLASLVRSTPLVVTAASLASTVAAKLVLRLCGWAPGHAHDSSGIECWVRRGVQGSTREHAGGGDPHPLVLIPGAGNGMVSFVPFALLMQRRVGPARTLVLFRLPHVEVRVCSCPLVHFSCPLFSDMLVSFCPRWADHGLCCPNGLKWSKASSGAWRSAVWRTATCSRTRTERPSRIE
jgi:hypothetical protein